MGVATMTDFFDLFRKTVGRTGDSSSAAVQAAWKAIDGDADVQRPPLLQGAGSPENGNPTDSPQILVEELDVQPGTRIVFHGDPGSPGADRFRFLRMRLRELWKETK